MADSFLIKHIAQFAHTDLLTSRDVGQYLMDSNLIIFVGIGRA